MQPQEQHQGQAGPLAWHPCMVRCTQGVPAPLSAYLIDRERKKKNCCAFRLNCSTHYTNPPPPLNIDDARPAPRPKNALCDRPPRQSSQVVRRLEPRDDLVSDSSPRQPVARGAHVNQGRVNEDHELPPLFHLGNDETRKTSDGRREAGKRGCITITGM